MTNHTKEPAACAFKAFGCLVCIAIVSNAFGQSKNSMLTSNAWIHFEYIKNYPVAISNALACISEFGDDAQFLQSELSRTNAVIPNGKVIESVADTIHANGLLNDVCTCYFIIGEAEIKLAEHDANLLEKARKAYESASLLTFARCWDTNGWFWSPSSIASRRLKKLPPSLK